MAAYVERAAAIFGAEVNIVHVCDLSFAALGSCNSMKRPTGTYVTFHLVQ
jgi:hypothetical protein